MMTMNLENLSKTKALLLLLGMYVIAFVAGVVAYRFSETLVTHIIWRTLFANVIATLVIYGFGVLIDNQSVYDPYWSVAPPVIVIAWIVTLDVTLHLPVVLLLMAILFWSIRLTYNFIINFDDFSYQDWRYVMLHDKHPGLWLLTNLFGINLMPTIIVFIQLIGAYHVLLNAATINVMFVLGFILSVSAAFIQYISDKQMMAFRMDHKQDKGSIDQGLWSYSRHPNYFGEVMMWWGIYLMYLSVVRTLDWQIVSPLLMTALFLFISIPMMEEKLKERPGYTDYQEEVSVLVPFPRKSQKEDKPKA